MKCLRAAVIFAASLYCLCAWAEPAQLGRLFYTPEERLTLNRNRPETSSDRAASNRLVLKGRITRSDGKTVEWVNGEQTPRPAEPRTRSMRVGDALDPATGTVQSTLDDDGVAVKNDAKR